MEEGEGKRKSRERGERGKMGMRKMIRERGKSDR